MSVNTKFIAIALCIHFIGCKHVEPSSDGSLRAELAAESQRQLTASTEQNEASSLSCLEQCGQEARGTVYADCMAEGGERQDCGSTGREWYRTCLETRCDESAIQLDDCRTECRINTKKEYTQCVSDSNEPQECRLKLKEDRQACIAECN